MARIANTVAKTHVVTLKFTDEEDDVALFDAIAAGAKADHKRPIDQYIKIVLSDTLLPTAPQNFSELPTDN
jgi:hypothetical protein